MIFPPKRITIAEWDEIFPLVTDDFRLECRHLRRLRDEDRFYLATPSHYSAKGDRLLDRLKFDSSPAALRLWSFIFSEKERLFDAKRFGWKIFAAMKDLGVVPIITYSLQETLTFYADEMWWAPCFAENPKLLDIAGRFGAGDELCFVRAALGAMKSGDCFPEPDLCIAGVGSCCDDFSSVMQLIEWQGFKTHWWEMPSRTLKMEGERREDMVCFIARELRGVAEAAAKVAKKKITPSMFAKNIIRFNRIRRLVAKLRKKVYGAEKIPMPGLEMFLAEFIAPHACSDPEEAENVLKCLLGEVELRLAAGSTPFSGCPVRIYWVMPPTDASLITLLEDAGAVVCGSEYMIGHSFIPVKTAGDPYRALAENHLRDLMSGPCEIRTEKIVREALEFRAEGVIISGIFGASHCPFEEKHICEEIRNRISLPVMSFDVPFSPGRTSEQVKSRIESFVEIIKGRRRRGSSKQ